LHGTFGVGKLISAFYVQTSKMAFTIGKPVVLSNYVSAKIGLF
jgi:hypothetical protein